MNNTIDIKDLNFKQLDDRHREEIRSFKIGLLKQAFINRLIISVFVFLFIMVFQCIAQVIAEKDLTPTIIACLVLFAVFNLASMIVFLTKAKVVEYSDDTTYIEATITKLLGAKQVNKEDFESYKDRLKLWKENHNKEIAEYQNSLKEWNSHYKKWKVQNAKIEADPDYIEKSGEEEIKLKLKPVPDYSRRPVRNKRRGFGDSNRIPNYLFFTCEQGDCTSAINVASDETFDKLKVDDKIKIIKISSLNKTTYDIIPM